MARYNSPISVVDVKDKKVRDALLIAMENCQYFKERIDEQQREIELLKKRKVVPNA
jgi:hypothetical protein